MELICPFDSDEPEFARGVEVGILWERLKSGEPCSAMVHAGNVEMIMRIAETFGMGFCAEDLSDEWIRVEFH